MEEMRDGELERAARSSGERPRTGDAERRDGSDEEAVRRRAYENYLARGDGPGSEMDDWLAAEREMREARPEDTPEELADVEPKSRPRSKGRGRAD